MACASGCTAIGRGAGFMPKLVGVDSWVFLTFAISKCISMEVWSGLIFPVPSIFMFPYPSDAANIDLLSNRSANLHQSSSIDYTLGKILNDLVFSIQDLCQT